MIKPPEDVLETCIYVDDLDAAQAFYERVLRLKLIGHEAGRYCFYRLGKTLLLVFRRQASAEPGHDLPPHGSHGPSHVALAVLAEDIAAWRAHLQDAGVAIEHEEHWPEGEVSLYFRDPDGNSLELAPRSIWQG